MPDTSNPMTSLAPGGGGYLPAAWRRSARLTPAARTRIRTSSFAGATSATFSQVRWPSAEAAIACIFPRYKPVCFPSAAILTSLTIAPMVGMIAGRTAGDMPGLDIAEQRSWQNYLDSALRMYATLNRSLVDAHHLTLNDVRLLDMLDKSSTGSARMGDLAERLMSLPSRVTRQIRRLEVQNLVTRCASPDDGRGVVATITEEGRAAVREAMVTYGAGCPLTLSRQALASADRGDGGELPPDQRRAEERMRRPLTSVGC